MMRALTVLAALMGFASIGAPAAATSYKLYFTGNCSDCTGTGLGTLLLKDYTLGDTLTTENFVSFKYKSNLLSYSISNITNVVGAFPASGLPGPAFVGFGNADYAFTSNKAGPISFWCTGTIGTCDADYGMTSSWSLAASVPEPAMWGMMVVGFGMLGAGMRRSQRVAPLQA